jgi:hypothetical protein
MSLILSGSDGLSDVDGTAATPAIRGTDTNTGIFFPAADTIAFSEGGTEAMRIDSSGNVGIGTSSPSYKLSIAGNSATSSNLLLTHNTDSTGAYSRIRFQFAEGNASIASEIRNIQRAAGENGTSLAFFTDSNAGSLAERMRIDSSGNLLVGKTATAIGTVGFVVTNYGVFLSTTATGDYSIFNKSTSTTGKQIEFRSADTTVGNITSSSVATSYNTSSDYRLKENITPMTGALGLVQQLKPVTYNWKVDGSSSQGFIAHELQEVVPDCVTGEKDAIDAEGNPEYQGIDTSFLVATLTAAIQELKATVDAQAARIAALENPPVESATNE